ncbi:MAG: hypothetical protein ACKN89_04785 [Cyanobium sp.]
MLVQIGVAGGGGHGLAQGLEFGLGTLDADGLGVVGRAAYLRAGDGLQGEEQQKAEGGGHGQLAAEAGAVFQQWIMGTELSGDLEQGQAEQGEGCGADQRASQAQLPGGIKQLQREEGCSHQGGEQHQRHHAQARGRAERSKELPLREGSELGGMAELWWSNSEKELPPAAAMAAAGGDVQAGQWGQSKRLGCEAIVVIALSLKGTPKNTGSVRAGHGGPLRQLEWKESKAMPEAILRGALKG